jgi:hypothetical protein
VSYPLFAIRNNAPIRENPKKPRVAAIRQNFCVRQRNQSPRTTRPFTDRGDCGSSALNDERTLLRFGVLVGAVPMDRRVGSRPDMQRRLTIDRDQQIGIDRERD